MTTLRTRAGKGSELTHNELDANFKRAVTRKTADYQVLVSDNQSTIEGYHATVAFEVTLPTVADAAASETEDFNLTVTNLNNAIVSVDGSGTEGIDGSDTPIALHIRDSVTVQLYANDSAWKIVGRHQSRIHTLPHGAAPSSPVNGDMWTETTGLYVRINGATVGPLS